jgi:hypothetical protein
MECETLFVSRHALQRMFSRGITMATVRAVLAGGVVVEDYPDDTPYPNVLMMGFEYDDPIHVVVARDHESRCYVVTVYRPDPERWDETFTRRRTP